MRRFSPTRWQTSREERSAPDCIRTVAGRVETERHGQPLSGDPTAAWGSADAEQRLDAAERVERGLGAEGGMPALALAPVPALAQGVEQAGGVAGAVDDQH